MTRKTFKNYVALLVLKNWSQKLINASVPEQQSPPAFVFPSSCICICTVGLISLWSWVYNNITWLSKFDWQNFVDFYCGLLMKFFILLLPIVCLRLFGRRLVSIPGSWKIFFKLKFPFKMSQPFSIIWSSGGRMLLKVVTWGVDAIHLFWFQF